MDRYLVSLLFFSTLFFSMILFVYLGRLLFAYQIKKHPDHVPIKNKIIEGAIFALMGLLIAFTFASAHERFDTRRILVIDEANAIEATYFRLDLLPSVVKEETKKYLREYVQARLTIYKKMPRLEEAMPYLHQSRMLLQQIWNVSVQTCQHENSEACIVLLPAVNKMIEMANTRFETTRIHPPPVVLIVLGVLALASAILSGYNIPNKSAWPWLHIFAYAALTSFVIFIIVNLEYPHFGFIPINYFDDVLVDVTRRIS